MLDISYIRENTNKVKEDTKAKGVEVDIDKLLSVDEERRILIAKSEEIRAKRNEHAAKLQGKPSDQDIEAGRAIKEELSKVEDDLNKVERVYRDFVLSVPNVLADDVPVGADDSANKVIETFGKKPEFVFEPKDHAELGKSLDLIDTETSAQTSGTRFYYLKNEAVQLQFALVNWVLAKVMSKGLSPVIPPTLVHEKMMEATGFFPADKNEIYQVNADDEDLYLVGTSEVPLAGLHMFAPLAESEAPKRYAGYSTCYRREAGTYGKDTKGIIRVHQFDKIEMYSFVRPEDSEAEHQFMLDIEKEIFTELGLHFQIVNVCSGDLGSPATKKYDCEAWFPAQGKFRELSSTSNTTDYQARRGNIKLKGENGLRFAHTVNGTAVAIPRTMAAIFENYQTDDGHIKIPEVLVGFMGGKEVI